MRSDFLISSLHLVIYRLWLRFPFLGIYTVVISDHRLPVPPTACPASIHLVFLLSAEMLSILVGSLVHFALFLPYNFRRIVFTPKLYTARVLRIAYADEATPIWRRRKKNYA